MSIAEAAAQVRRFEETFGEQPLAVIEIGRPDYRSLRVSKPVARQWAKDHPDAEGFIVVTGNALAYKIGGTGGSFFKVLGGKIQSSSAHECFPLTRAAWDAL